MMICLMIAVVSGIVALLMGVTPGLRIGVSHADDAIYDTYYRLRPFEDQNDKQVVIVTVDQQSLDAVDAQLKYGWPWPREFWGHIAAYLDKCGAKAVAFDMIFSETSVYQNQTGDDDAFAALVNPLKIPIIFGCLAKPDGSWEHFAPKMTNPPNFGAVNVGKDVIYRRYLPEVFGKPSLASAALRAAGIVPTINSPDGYLIHYYGPNTTIAGDHTFHYVPAVGVLAAAMGDKGAEKWGATPDVFRGKVVLIGVTAAATFDVKSSPLSQEYPGVEIQATAIRNLTTAAQVVPVGTFFNMAATFLGAMLAAFGVVFPRRATFKALAAVGVVAALICTGALLFQPYHIIWLPTTVPLIAILLSSAAAFSWTFFAEDRQRKFMLKALGKVVSPAVAAQLAANPQRLQLGTTRTEVTLLFTDLANFTGMSESMDVQKVGELLNRYLGEMSDQVLANQGTLDKYIGDAIMCFWNAPLPQPDHAACACRAALAIVAREEAIRPELQSMGATLIFTRIGVNTTPAAVGFVGSSHLFNYTALGDGVNLASRLEGANKLYGTRILLAQSTADLVRNQFILRKVDNLRVKGKSRPMSVYEPLAEKGKSANEADLKIRVELYERALADYLAKNWESAEGKLLELLKHFADDSAANALLERVRHLKADPPPEDWDGVYVAKDK